MTLWQMVLAFLVWLSAEPAAIDVEAPRAAAAVAAARASMATEPPAAAAAAAPEAASHPAQAAAPCPDGRCVRVSGASSSAVAPVAPAGGR